MPAANPRSYRSHSAASRATRGCWKRSAIRRAAGQLDAAIRPDRSLLAFPKLFRGRFNGGFERRQIVLNCQPREHGVDSVVFVPQEVFDGAQLGAWYSGAKLLGDALLTEGELVMG
jgi:hypothetical protein